VFSNINQFIAVRLRRALAYFIEKIKRCISSGAKFSGNEVLFIHISNMNLSSHQKKSKQGKFINSRLFVYASIIRALNFFIIIFFFYQ